MASRFEPRNELEEQLQDAQEGRLAADVFIRQLMDAQVFLPVRDSVGIEGFQNSNRAEPLTVQAENGARALVVFTSPERAKGFVGDFPGYEGGLLAQFSWVLERVGGGCGVALNPGCEVGLDLPPEMVEQLAQARSEGS